MSDYTACKINKSGLADYLIQDCVNIFFILFEFIDNCYKALRNTDNKKPKKLKKFCI